MRPLLNTSRARSETETTAAHQGRPRSRRQLERQERAFDLRIAGMTIRALAVALGVSPPTVLEDLAHEQQRRADEIGMRRRAIERARAIATYERVINKAWKKSELNDQLLEKILAGAKASVSDCSLDFVVKARQRIDKIMMVDPIARYTARVERVKAVLAEAEVEAEIGSGSLTGDENGIEVVHTVMDETGPAIARDANAMNADAGLARSSALNSHLVHPWFYEGTPLSHT